MVRRPLLVLALALLACTEPNLVADDCPVETVVPGPVDADRDGFPEAVDCDDTSSRTYPGAPELTDAVDNDCDGLVDEYDCTGGAWRMVEIQPDPVTDLDAELIQGDVEFGGFGPQVTVQIEVINERHQIDVDIHVDFAETAHNWSVGRVSHTLEGAYVPPAGCAVAAVQSGNGISEPGVLSTLRRYTDDDVEDDILDSDHLIDEMVLTGDIVGPDIGYGTGVVSLTFQPLTLLLYCADDAEL